MNNLEKLAVVAADNGENFGLSKVRLAKRLLAKEPSEEIAADFLKRQKIKIEGDSAEMAEWKANVLSDASRYMRGKTYSGELESSGAEDLEFLAATELAGCHSSGHRDWEAEDEAEDEAFSG